MDIPVDFQIVLKNLTVKITGYSRNDASFLRKWAIKIPIFKLECLTLQHFGRFANFKILNPEEGLVWGDLILLVTFTESFMGNFSRATALSSLTKNSSLLCHKMTKNWY